MPHLSYKVQLVVAVLQSHRHSWHGHWKQRALAMCKLPEKSGARMGNSIFRETFAGLIPSILLGHEDWPMVRYDLHTLPPRDLSQIQSRNKTAVDLPTTPGRLHRRAMFRQSLMFLAVLACGWGLGSRLVASSYYITRLGENTPGFQEGEEKYMLFFSGGPIHRDD